MNEEFTPDDYGNRPDMDTVFDQIDAEVMLERFICAALTGLLSTGVNKNPDWPQRRIARHAVGIAFETVAELNRRQRKHGGGGA